MSKMGLRVGNCGLYDECSGKEGMSLQTDQNTNTTTKHIKI